MRSVSVAVKITVAASRETAFNVAVSIDPRRLVQQFGPLPAIIGGDGHEAPWRRVGQRRRHLLSDETSVNEELTLYEPPNRFAYRVTEFTGPFAALAQEATGAWSFMATTDSRTMIIWRYDFMPNSSAAAPALYLIAKLFWPGYLNAALRRVKDHAENGAQAGALTASANGDKAPRKH